MNARANRINWLVFFALGFMWGSSYLFIKLAVDDFGTFTLVAFRLVVGALLLWIVVRIAKQPLPRERRIYGHLLVMAIINITIPFLLITWAEQSVESSLAAILTSPVPLFAIVLSSLFLADEPMRVNGVVGLVVGFIGVVIITSRGLTGAGSSVIGELALLGAAFSYACGAVYSRRNVRGLAPMIPAVFQVTFAAIITGTVALLFEHPWTATPDAEAIFSILWLGILGSGLAYLLGLPPVRRVGRDAHHARRLPHPRLGDRPRLPRPPGTGRRADHHRNRAGHRRDRGRQQQVRTAAAVRADARRATGRSRLARADEPQLPTASNSAPPTINAEAPIRRTASERSLASPSRTEPHAAANTVADSRRGATPDNGATLSATRMHRYAMSVSQPPTAARRAAAGP